MSLDLSRFHQTFFEESREGLDAMEAALLQLDIGNADSETINTIFRAAHSIKGGAGTFGFSGISEFTHVIETLLDQMRSGKRAVTQPDVDLLLRGVDMLRALFAAAREGSPLDTAAVAEVHAQLEKALKGEAAAAPSAPATIASIASVVSSGWRIRFAPRPGLFRSGNDPLRILRELDQLGRLTVELDATQLPELAQAEPEDCYLAWNLTLTGDATRAQLDDLFAWVEDECELTFAPLAPVEKPQRVQGGAVTEKPEAHKDHKEHKDHKSGDGGSIRVSTDKIDMLINLVGELVITQSMLAQTAGQLDPVINEKLLGGLSQLDRNTRLLQEAVMSTRMLPMDFVFSRFPRVVRDLAAKLGKQVRLQTVGEHTELDKSVIEKIADPLNHLVRNSLDHGIETPDQRVAAGKPGEGTIHLKAAHQGGHIVIEVSDDGRGLSREKILAKARAQNLPVSDSMSDAEVWALIFAPGFSTAETVTDVSGRGVGMDVVKKNIQALGGKIELNSQPGHGMQVTIRLPLTLAILDGMSVAVGDEVFIVPLNCVVEALQAQPGHVKSIANRDQLIRVRNEYVPLMALHRVFKLPSRATEAHAGILLLLESEGRKLALLVDELLGQQQVVIKSLEANYRHVSGVSGATILGDGRVALILDVGELVQALTRAAAA